MSSRQTETNFHWNYFILLWQILTKALIMKQNWESAALSPRFLVSIQNLSNQKQKRHDYDLERRLVSETRHTRTTEWHQHGRWTQDGSASGARARRQSCTLRSRRLHRRIAPAAVNHSVVSVLKWRIWVLVPPLESVKHLHYFAALVAALRANRLQLHLFRQVESWVDFCADHTGAFWSCWRERKKIYCRL